jgi:hypothetical protein
MARKPKSSNNVHTSNKSTIEVIVAKYGLISTIVVALLGVIGTFLTAYFGYLGIQAQIEKPIMAAQTAAAQTQTAETRLAETHNIMTMTQLAITPSITLTPLQTDTQTPTPTFTAMPTDDKSKILLQDDFIDNTKRWRLPNDQYIKSNISGGKFNLEITCPAGYEESSCKYYFTVPSLSADDLQFEIDATIKDISPNNGEVWIVFLFRMKDNNYYDVYFKSIDNYIGDYAVSMVKDGFLIQLLKPKPIVDFGPNTDTVKRYGFSAIGSSITPIFNGQELSLVKDGNIKQAGSVQIAIFVSRGSKATVELDNLIATDKSEE